MFLRKSLFVALLLAVVVIPATSHATISRVMGLGGEGANYIVRDAYNPTVWPQLIYHFPQQGGAEFYNSNGWNFQKAYINYDFGNEKSVMQLSLDRSSTRMFGWGGDMADLAGLDALSGGYSKLNVVYGRPMGEDMLFGAAIKLGGKSYKTNADGGNIDDAYSEYGLKLGLTAMEEKLDASVGFCFGSWNTNDGPNGKVESDGASTISLAGRYWHEVNEDYSLIPNLSVDLHSDGTKYDGGATSKATSTDFKLGLGNNWTPKDNMLAIFELGLQSMSTKYEMSGGGASSDATDSQMDLYWRLGLESEIFSWLNGRFGAERAWRGAKMETSTGQPETGTNPMFTYLGATAHSNRFIADVLVNPTFIANGPYFISGMGQPLFARASLKIDFSKE